MVRRFVFAILLLSLRVLAYAQKTLPDSADGKELAVAEFGGAAGVNLAGGRWSFGPSVAVEVTPIENWLELELGVTPAFGVDVDEVDVDLLVKKPWTLSRKVEFMFGVGPDWSHFNDHAATTNSIGGEVALDFMFWPYLKHRIGWYFEPEYEYGFGQGHEQSVQISGGLLVAIR